MGRISEQVDCITALCTRLLGHRYVINASFYAKMHSSPPEPAWGPWTMLLAPSRNMEWEWVRDGREMGKKRDGRNVDCGGKWWEEKERDRIGGILGRRGGRLRGKEKRWSGNISVISGFWDVPPTSLPDRGTLWPNAVLYCTQPSTAVDQSVRTTPVWCQAARRRTTAASRSSVYPVTGFIVMSTSWAQRAAMTVSGHRWTSTPVNVSVLL